MSCKQTYNLIGLCVRAGLCRIGMEACREEIKNNRAAAVLIGSSLARNTRSKIEALCRAKSIRISQINDENGELGACVGRPGIKIICIQDRCFACRIIESM